MSWKILVTARTVDAIGQHAMAMLRAAGCTITMPPKPGPFSPEAIIPLLEGHDACYATTDKYTEAVLSAKEAGSLKCISRWGVGFDSVDVSAATRHGVVVTNTPGILDEAVADFAFAMLLAVARRVHVGSENLKSGVWGGAWGHDVHGKTLGIIGCGRIGQAVARRAAGFNLRVMAYDLMPHPAAIALGVKFVSLDALLAESDFVTLHAAMTPASRGIIGATALQKMKRTAYLINAGRGALVDEAALVEALRMGTIAGAALDTFNVEPLPADHPLRSCPNVLLTPHLASFARETGERVSETASQALIDLMAGRRPRFVVNPDVFSSPALRVKMDGSR